MNNTHIELETSGYSVANELNPDFPFRIEDAQKLNHMVKEDADNDYMSNANVMAANYDLEFEEADKEIGELLNPTWDYIFKRLFGNKNKIDILRNFLNSIIDLGTDELDSVILVNPQYDKTYKEEKMTIFDIKAVTKSGITYDIELQRTKVDMMAERTIFYTCRMLHEQLQSGNEYGKIKRAVTIVIADFDFVPDKDHYHGRYRYHDRENNSTLSDVTEIHILELNKVQDVRDGKLWDWMKFFKSKTKEEFKMLAENNKELEPAVDELEKLSRDRAARFAAWREEKEWRDRQAVKTAAWKDGIAEGRAEGRVEGIAEGREEGIAEGREEGIAEGLAKGREAGAIEIAKAMIENNVDIDIIIKTTGLSKDQLQKL